jgi:hypothetical protein
MEVLLYILSQVTRLKLILGFHFLAYFQNLSSSQTSYGGKRQIGKHMLKQQHSKKNL